MTRHPKAETPKSGLLAQFTRGVKKSRSYFSAHGMRDTINMVHHNVFSIELFYRMEKQLKQPELKLEAKIPLDIRTMSGKLTLADEALQKVRGIRGQYGLDQFEERLARGDVMFGAYNEDKLAAFVWLEYPPVVDAGYEVADDMGFTYDAWTFDEYRGNRIFPVIQQAIFDHVRENNPEIKRLLTQVATWNAASAIADQRAGYIILNVELSVIFIGYNKRFKIGYDLPPSIMPESKLDSGYTSGQ